MRLSSYIELRKEF